MIEDYSHEKHFEKLSKWLKQYEITPNKILMSTTGIVIDDMAIGFLFFTNSKIAYIDNFVADPEMLPTVKDGALRTLIHELEKRAASEGVEVLYVLSNLEKMNRRWTSESYLEKGQYKLFVKQL